MQLKGTVEVGTHRVLGDPPAIAQEQNEHFQPKPKGAENEANAQEQNEQALEDRSPRVHAAEKMAKETAAAEPEKAKKEQEDLWAHPAFKTMPDPDSNRVLGPEDEMTQESQPVIASTERVIASTERPADCSVVSRRVCDMELNQYETETVAAAWEQVCKLKKCGDCKECPREQTLEKAEQSLEKTGGGVPQTKMAKTSLVPIQGPVQLRHYSARVQKQWVAAGGSGPPDGKKECYHRGVSPQTMVVDMHYHDRPFGGAPIEFTQQMSWAKEQGILFVVLNGIGQRLPIEGENGAAACTYYLNCTGSKSKLGYMGLAKPSLVNDLWNAQTYLDWRKAGADQIKGVDQQEVLLSMTYGDLADADSLVTHFNRLMTEFPGPKATNWKGGKGLFNWVGELNVVKQGLQGNGGGFPVTEDQIKAWKPWMKLMEEAKLPVSLHCDMGKNGEEADRQRYLPLFKLILELYPNNKIVWLHLGGLSRELHFKGGYKMATHAATLRELLAKNKNLLIDLSWDVLFDNVFFGGDRFQNEMEAKSFINLMTEFPDRFLTGTDFVAADTKTADVYAYQVQVTSYAGKFLDDETFRKIWLGGNFFDLLKLRRPELDYEPPAICPPDAHFKPPKGSD